MGKIELMTLPYAMDALEPVISRQTLEFHHEAIVRDFGSFEAFKEAFQKGGATLFDSGCVVADCGLGGDREEV